MEGKFNKLTVTPASTRNAIFGDETITIDNSLATPTMVAIHRNLMASQGVLPNLLAAQGVVTSASNSANMDFFGLTSLIRIDADNPNYTNNALAMFGRGYIGPNLKKTRGGAYGVLAEAHCPTGSDGLLIGLEAGLENKGTVVTNPHGPRQKVNIWLGLADGADCNKATAGIAFHNASPRGGHGWAYGVYICNCDVGIKLDHAFQGVTTAMEFGSPIKMMTDTSIIPAADKQGSIGTAVNRFKQVRAVTVKAGDFVFENGWRLTEHRNGIALVRPDGSHAHTWN